MRGRSVGAVFFGPAILLASSALVHAEDQGRTLGFLAYDFNYYSAEANEEACPDGLNTGARDLFLGDQTDAERERLLDPDNGNELRDALDRAIGSARDKPNACTMPLDYKNYGLKTYQSAKHYGLNLDGVGSTTEQTAAPNTCGHQNFVGFDGRSGVDNQMGRAVGCTRAYMRGGDFDNTTPATLIDGSYSVLIELRDVDDLQNDDEITVGFYSGQGTVMLDPAGKILPYQSLVTHENERFHNETKGKIVNGVVTTEPFDLHLEVHQQVIHSEHWIRAARFEGKLHDDGSMTGTVGGYYDLEKRWEHVTHAGVITSILTGYNCPGLYEAFQKFADGFPDPETGKCTAISSAMRVGAIPAFVIHEPYKPQTAQAE